MNEWLEELNADPLPWLLARESPAVRHLALVELLDHDADDGDVREARAAAMSSDPIASILAAQDAEGWWVKPGAGYGPKYTGTIWQLVFLDQLGADPDDERVRRACEYVLAHTQAKTGGFGATAASAAAAPPPSSVIHCLNGNLVRALIGLGWLGDPRLERAIEWQAAAIVGADGFPYNATTPGPDFRCGANEGLPCAWGATKALLALSRVPPAVRSRQVERAIEVAVGFLLSHNPAVAEYPMGYGNTKPSGSWFRLGFPVGYIADVLQVLEAVCEAGAGDDDRLRPALAWLLAQQDERGRWANRHAYEGKLVRDIDAAGQPSKWVTLRACRVLRRVAEAREAVSIA